MKKLLEEIDFINEQFFFFTLTSRTLTNGCGEVYMQSKERLVVCVIILGNIFSILWFSRFFKKILIIYTEYTGEGDQFHSTTDYLK